MNQRERKPLALPALRAQLGEWVYYITFMKMADVSERVGLADELNNSQPLNA